MWALWETAFCAVFQRPCGRVVGVHRSGSVHARFCDGRGADALIRKAVDAGQALIDLLGQRVSTLYSGWQGAGTHQFRWDGTDRGVQLGLGPYLIRLLMNGKQTSVRKLLLLR